MVREQLRIVRRTVPGDESLRYEDRSLRRQIELRLEVIEVRRTIGRAETEAAKVERGRRPCGLGEYIAAAVAIHAHPIVGTDDGAELVSVAAAVGSAVSLGDVASEDHPDRLAAGQRVRSDDVERVQDIAGGKS